jgi:pyridoxal phosphate enzyme (YggS family)
MTIASNLEELRDDVKKICLDCQRNPAEIEIIAVSKYVSVAKMCEAYAVGIKNFGENRVQEYLSKKGSMPKDICWHFIGGLQTNKVKDILSGITLIHSLDRVDLADEIEKQAKKKNISSVPCLIQVNIAKEETKAGFELDEVEVFLKERLERGSAIDFQGIMTIGPNHSSRENCSVVFQKARDLFLTLKERYAMPNFKKLSMGMTADYDVAIRAGANMIRVGSKVFGMRAKA